MSSIATASSARAARTASAREPDVRRIPRGHGLLLAACLSLAMWLGLIHLAIVVFAG